MATEFKQLSATVHASAQKVLGASINNPTEPLRAIAPETVELKDGDTLELEAQRILKHFDNVAPTILSFNGSFPGPTLKVKQGAEATIHLRNHHGLMASIRWHGLRTSQPSNSGLTNAVGALDYQLCFRDPGVYWYYSSSRKQRPLQHGLYGNIVVTPADPHYWPPVNSEYALALDAIPIEGMELTPATRAGSGRSTIRFSPRVVLLNGEVSGTLKARRGEVVRLYLTNAAVDRSFTIRLPGARMKLIGADHGRVEREVMVEEVLIGPAERAIIDVLFEKVGIFTLEHRIPGKSHPLGSVEVDDALVDASFRAAFETLRYNSEFAEERNKLAVDFMRAPDKTFLITSEALRARGSQTTLGKVVEEDTGKSNQNIHWTFTLNNRIKIRLVNTSDPGWPAEHTIHFQAQRFLELARDGVPNDNLAWKDTLLLHSGETADILLEASSPGTWLAEYISLAQPENSPMFTFDIHGEHQEKGGQNQRHTDKPYEG